MLRASFVIVSTNHYLLARKKYRVYAPPLPSTVKVGSRGNFFSFERRTNVVAILFALANEDVLRDQKFRQPIEWLVNVALLVLVPPFFILLALQETLLLVT